MSRFRIALAAFVLAAGAVAALGRPVQTVEAALLMADIAAGEAPSAWKALTSAPTAEPLSWSREERPGEGDLYRPAGRARGALVLAPGAAQLGRGESRLVALAESLARAGFVVLAPELPGARRLALGRIDAVALADALRTLAEKAPGLPLGVAAISYGVGPAVIAALEDDLAPRVDFLLGIGGYYDTDSAIRFLTTGFYRGRGDAGWSWRRPAPYARWAFVLANAARLDDPHDVVALQRHAMLALRGLPSDTAALRAGLGPQGRAVLDLLDNADPERVPALIAALPASVRVEIDALNLALHDLRRLHARLILVHGRDDPMVPHVASHDLAAAAPQGRARVHVVDGIGHVEFNAVAAENALALWRASRDLLARRR